MGNAGKLSRVAIVREAIALLQEGGLQEVSLRKIAARLGARAPSLARHVGDKAQLMALMSATIVCDALESIPPGLKGDDWLEAFGHAVRSKQSETRDISAILTSTPPDESVDKASTDRLRGLMREAGLEGPRAQVEQAAIQALVTGWMTFEKSPRSALFTSRLPNDHAFEDSLKALIAGFAQER